MNPRITIDSRIMCGKPVIQGTRITVELILRKLGAGMTSEEIIGDHAYLTHEDILSALEFAADHMANWLRRRPITPSA
jgi:uncharacterized protein (DUF433 family)